ncbi:MAG: glycoside hydrolase family 108 protein [Bosea sp. (in: a-proteobacteria)]
MAQASFSAALKLILKHEGGYVDHPLDPGGATNRGITRATLAGYRGRPVSKAEVMALGEREAGDIYRKLYWNAVRADELPPGVDLVAFDAAVNSGPGRAVRWLQMALSLKPDGVVASGTISAANRAEPRKLVIEFGRQRLGFLQRLGTWRTFGRGWARRVRETESAALALAGPGRATPQIIRQKEPTPMTNTKSLLTSKTLWSNFVGLSAVMLSIFGINASGVDHAGLSQAIPQVVAGLSFIASSVFRVTASKRIAMT